MRALLALIAAAALAALQVHFGPKWAEAMLPALGLVDEPDYPRIETLYSAIIFGGLLVVALIGGAVARVNPLRLGERPGWMLPLGAAIGLTGVLTAAGYAWLAGGMVRAPSPPMPLTMLLWGTAIVVFQTTIEEAYFRGWLQPVLAREWGTWPAILAATLVFAMLHILAGADTIVSIVNLFLGGLLFGMLAARSGGIAGATAAHFAWNWTEQIVLGLTPNPGTGSFGALIDFDLVGDPRWGGSSEGLNASAAMTLALIALLVPLLLLWRFGRAERA